MTVQAYEEYDCDYRWYWRSMRAALHAYRGEFEDAREVLESLGTRFDPEGCAYVLADAQSVRREAYGLSGKSGELLLLAQAAADREDWDSVEALIEAARSVHLEGEELIGQNDQIALLELRRSLDVGDVYRATFERGMPGWRLRGGGEGFVGSGKLRPLLSGEGFQAVVPLDLGERYRIGVTIDFECAGANWRAQRAGLIFGYEERGEDQGWMSFWVSAKRRRAYISRGNWDRDEGYSVSTPPLAKKVRLTLDVWDRQVVARVDDQVVFTGPLDFDFERWTPGSRVGLVVPYRPYHPACFSDFTVERLTKAPVELDAPGARRRARAARDRVDLADAPPRIADEPKDKPEVEP